MQAVQRGQKVLGRLTRFDRICIYWREAVILRSLYFFG